MLLRGALLFLLAVTLPVLAVRADPPPTDLVVHEGTIVRMDASVLVTLDRDGTKLHTDMLTPTTAITCDGVECKLTDLQPGMDVKVLTRRGSTNTALRVDARTKSVRNE
jgi:hypothetical protein